MYTEYITNYFVQALKQMHYKHLLHMYTCIYMHIHSFCALKKYSLSFCSFYTEYRLHGPRHKPSSEAARIVFADAVKEGPHYVCTRCHCLTYQKTVVEFKPIKYPARLPDHLYNAVFATHLLYTSAEDKLWICKTCDSSLK